MTIGTSTATAMPIWCLGAVRRGSTAIFYEMATGRSTTDRPTLVCVGSIRILDMNGDVVPI